MMELLDQGHSIAEALTQSADFSVPGFFSNIKPDMLLLRLRLLVNKAHVFTAGSHGVPFFEYLGAPPELMAKIRAERENKNPKKVEAPEIGKNDALPAEILDSGQCVGNQPCPPVNAF